MEVESFENYIKHMVNEGFIKEDGTPLKCPHCEEKEFTEYDHDYLDYCYGHGVGLLEYKLKCNSCGKDVGYWVTGNWQI